MLMTILLSLIAPAGIGLIITGIVFLTKYKEYPQQQILNWVLMGCGVLTLLLVGFGETVTIWRGYYADNHHGVSKESVIEALKANPNEATIKMAEEWNEDETKDNTYLWRFTLRENDLIDIYQILLDYNVNQN